VLVCLGTFFLRTVSASVDKCVLYPRAFARSAAPAIVTDVFSAAGYSPCADPERASAIWSKNVLDLLVRRDQISNHLPGEHTWTQKEKLLSVLRRYDALHPAEAVFDFFPRSFLLHLPHECRAFASFINQSRAAHVGVDEDEVGWILKPAGHAGHNAAGIRIFTHAEAAAVVDTAASSSTSLCLDEPHVMQSYLTQPMLLDGRRVDVRAFMFVARTEPALVFFHPGYGRVAWTKYQPTTVTDGAAHVTNAKRPATASPSPFGRYVSFEAMGASLAPGVWNNSVVPQMHRAARISFLAGRHLVSRRPGYYGVYGGDYVVTFHGPSREARPHLIEWNFSPQMGGVDATLDGDHFGTVLWTTVLTVMELVRDRELGRISGATFCTRLPSTLGLLTTLINEACDDNRHYDLDDELVQVLL